MRRLTLEALGFTEADVWREIRDRWRRPEGEPKTEAEMRSLFRAEMLEEQARWTPEQRFRWMDAHFVIRWVKFRDSHLAEGATMKEIEQAWLADREDDVCSWADAD